MKISINETDNNRNKLDIIIANDDVCISSVVGKNKKSM